MTVEHGRTDRVGGLVRAIFDGEMVGSMADDELAERFAGGAGESSELAFAALVERHGPMVLSTCRGILRDEHAAQDAFQVSFLVLARKAGSLRVRGSLGPWLHQVAYRTASCLRANRARRRFHERRAVEIGGPETTSDTAADDLAAPLHEEVARLPERYRRPIVLCYLEGLTHEQAAHRLAWPVGTVRSRLSRGRDRLRSSLVRRGIAPALAVSLAGTKARAATLVAPTLVDSTIRASIRLAGASAGGLSPLAAALLEQVWKDMAMIRWAKAGAVVIAACGISVGGVLALRGAPPQRVEQKSVVKATEAERADRKLVEMNLKRIGLALHNYASGFGSLPPVAIQMPRTAMSGLGDRPLLSWRVAILPFLETTFKESKSTTSELFKRFRLNEPWDSPHNKALIAEMPPQFARPDGKPGETPFRAIVVDGHAFRVPFGVAQDKFMEIGDQTLVVAESADSVPWTKPDEIEYRTDGPLPMFGTSAGGFGASYLSGRVRFINETDPDKLRAILAQVSDSPAQPTPAFAPVEPLTDLGTTEQAAGAQADPRKASYAAALDLKEAVAILRSKMADEGLADVAALLSESKVRDSIRTAIRWQEAVYEKRIEAGGPGDDLRPLLEEFRRSAKPVFEAMAERGNWPRECWFTTFSTIRSADGIDHPCCGVRLRYVSPGSPTGHGLPILDLYYGMAFPVPK